MHDDRIHAMALSIRLKKRGFFSRNWLRILLGIIFILTPFLVRFLPEHLKQYLDALFH